MSTRTRSLAVFTALLALGAMPVPARAQAYPNRPITLVIPLPPGGTNDMMARAVADKLSTGLGQQVVIENRAAGGSGTVGTRQVAKSTPDGYTLLLGYTSTLATGPSMHRNVGYDPRKDFAPIGLIAVAPALLLVHPSVQVRNVSDLIAMMKAASPAFQVGTPGIGTVNHLASVLFAQQAGVDVQQSPPGLQSVDHRSRRRPRQGRLQSDPGVARGAGRRPDPGAGRDLAETLHPVPGTADRRRIGVARLRRGPELRAGGAGRHTAADHRAAEQGTAGRARDRRGQAAAYQEGAEPMATTPEEHAALIDREESKWSVLIKSIGLKPE